MTRPFSNGTQYMDWHDSNCGKCDKSSDDPEIGYKCDIQKVLDFALWGDGEVSDDVAQRMGYTNFGSEHYGWPCLDKLPAWDVAGWVERQKAIVRQ